MLELERITAHRNELDTLAEELAKQPAEVQAEREELVIAARVLHRPAGQDRAVAEAAAAVTAEMCGSATWTPLSGTGVRAATVAGAARPECFAVDAAPSSAAERGDRLVEEALGVFLPA
ncbi:hypothetical protein AB0P17_40870 [Streptomyces sp. NPDC088124]|uniref:hypothetical protein n=1 Tax=Streptomyces sp. NPDC088124 TaxID=3154654 RepID=UPI00342EAC94